MSNSASSFAFSESTKSGSLIFRLVLRTPKAKIIKKKPVEPRQHTLFIFGWPATIPAMKPTKTLTNHIPANVPSVSMAHGVAADDDTSNETEDDRCSHYSLVLIHHCSNGLEYFFRQSYKKNSNYFFGQAFEN
ncbi:unnamed protein product, partial [Nesidiocoris tenuis]